MLNNNDFARIEYTGYDRDGRVFDSTKGETALQLRNREGPVLVVIGRGQVIKGIEKHLQKMKAGDEEDFTVSPDEGFGEKRRELLKIMKETDFYQYNVDPKPGVSVHVDFSGNRMLGVIKSVSSGRVLVDFNHPLAGQPLRYKLKVVEVITATADKIRALIGESGLEGQAEFKDGTVTLEVRKKEGASEEEFKLTKASLISGLKNYIPEVKNIIEKE